MTRVPVLLALLLSTVALGCDATDADGEGTSIAGEWTGTLQATNESFGGPLRLDLQQTGRAITGTAYWNVFGESTAVTGVVNGVVSSITSVTYTIDYIRAGSIWGVQRHDMRLDGETLSGSWIYLSTDEFPGGSTRLTRR